MVFIGVTNFIFMLYDINNGVWRIEIACFPSQFGAISAKSWILIAFSCKNRFAMSGLIGVWVPTFKISSKDLVFEEISPRTNFYKKSGYFLSKTFEVITI